MTMFKPPELSLNQIYLNDFCIFWRIQKRNSTVILFWKWSKSAAAVFIKNAQRRGTSTMTTYTMYASTYITCAYKGFSEQ